MDLLIVWLLNGFALMIVAYLLKGVHIENYFSAFIAAAVLALVGSFFIIFVHEAGDGVAEIR